MPASSARPVPTRPALALLACALLTALVWGCRSGSATTAAAPSKGETNQTLTVFVPCGLIIPFSSAIDEFKRLHPELPVKGVYDNHLKLIAQLEIGERGDVFVSPGDAEMGYLDKRNLLEREPRVAVGSYAVVLVVPLGNPAGIKSVNDLVSPKVKAIAFPDPERNSVGYYAKQSLQKLGLWDKVQPKLQVVESAKTSHELVQKAQADAAFSFKTCPLPPEPEKVAGMKVQIVQELPRDSYDTPRVVARIMRDTPNRKAAEQFLDFLKQPATHDILLKNRLPDNLGLMSKTG
jgi:molybdate transport system substrate-binding protein